MLGTAAQMNVQMSQKLIILKQYINYVEMLKSRALVLQESCDLTDFKLVPQIQLVLYYCYFGTLERDSDLKILNVEY